MKAGWNYLHNSPKWHYFDADGRSLCNRFMVFVNDDADTEERLTSPDNCKACVAKRQRMLRPVADPAPPAKEKS